MCIRDRHQPRSRHRADAATRDETYTGLGDQAHLGKQQGTVGHVRVIARVLDRPGFGALFGQSAELQAHLHLLALGQYDFHGIGFGAAQQ